MPALFPLETMLYHHIRNNHFPPPANIDDVVQACKLAVNAINEGEPDKVICKVNGKSTTAAEIAEDWHLNDAAFIKDMATFGKED
jgi:hypothetical protein